MINPVSNNPYNAYTTNANRAAAGVENSEHFSLEGALSEQADREGVIYEPGHQSQEENKSATSSHSPAAAYIPSSVGSEDTSANEVSSEETNENFQAFFSKAREVITKFFSNLGRIFSNIWESKPLNEGAEIKEKAKEADTDIVSDIERIESASDEKIRKALTDGDKDAFRSLISDNGRRTPARNTGLLTYYDAKGNLVNIDPSDENKILHGNRGSHKS